MAIDTIVIKITKDTKDVTKTINELKGLKKVDKENARSFEKTSKKFRQDQKKNQQAASGFQKSISGLGTTLLGAFAVGALIGFVKDLSRTAAQMEAFEKRAAVVFGNSIGIVEKFAKENAISLGLSENAFKGAAAAVGDILVPLGLSRERAAEMSVEAVKLGSALKEFTGDQRSAAEIADIVARSFTGETEGLKGLGVVINQNDKDFKALQKSKIANLGLTEQQAKAEAIFETVLARSSDALTAFETNTDSLTRQQAELDAQTQTLTEGLATLLTPAFLELTKAANESVKVLNEIANSEENLLIKTLAFAQATGALGAIQLFDLSKFAEDASDAIEMLGGEEIKAAEATEKHIKTIGELKLELAALRKAQDLLIPSSIELAENQRRIRIIQDILKTSIQKTLTPIDKLNKKISDLRKELLVQALAGNINRATVVELELAVAKLEEAELRLKVAITGTLEPMKAQTLELEKIGEEAQTAGDLIKEFEEIQREEAEETADKRIENLNRVLDVEIGIFNVLSGINNRKLILIDNEQIANERALEAKFKQGILTEEQLATGQLKILEESDRQRALILTKQAKEDKLSAIFQATVNTAIAVTRALATSNIALSVLVGILGAAQIATIASQPIPTFHEGKKAELKEGEIFAKVLKTESVIPPKESKAHKGLIDSMIDGNLQSYVFKEYQLPLIKKMGKQSGNDYPEFYDGNITRRQSKQMRLTEETNRLLKQLKPSRNRQSYGWR